MSGNAICMLCGGEFTWPDDLIPGTVTHNCEPGRILQEQGSDALDAWEARQPKDPEFEQKYGHMTFDEYIEAIAREAEAADAAAKKG